MYIKHLLFENVGPIQYIDYTFPFDDEGKPKPVVLVGMNGSGKSILLSHIVNSLISAKQEIFENTEVEKGKVYKYRSPSYITTGYEYYFARLQFESDLESGEWQISMSRNDFESKFNYTPNHKEWSLVPEKETSMIWSNFNNKINDVKTLLNNNCVLYFPPNRFEEPAWLNYDNLVARAEFSDIKHIQGISNRSIIQYSPLTQNKNWLLDVLFDRQAFEIQTQNFPVQLDPTKNIPLPLFAGYSGPSTNLYLGILDVLRLIVGSIDNPRFGVGPRKNRQLTVMRNERPWIPNVFQLSTGETLVLNLFLSLLRDFDLTDGGFHSLDQVRGIMLVDEIDSHLHCDLQSNVIPSLMKRFPRVQFIVTSHSPLFLMGLQRELSDDGFRILSLPEGNEIGIERFSEFQNAYQVFKQSSAYENDLKLILERAGQDVVIVEGNYDVLYLRKAASLLGHEETIKGVELLDADGFGNLDKIWKHFDSRLAQLSPRKTLLVYDCDTTKQNADRGRIIKRVVPSVSGNPITKGIENLFPQSTIDAARKANPRFIDVTPAVKRVIRGNEIIQPEVLEVNKDEKANLCNWLCQNGTVDDFIGFQSVFHLIRNALEEGSGTREDEA